jgi:hypothetical protein
VEGEWAMSVVFGGRIGGSFAVQIPLVVFLLAVVRDSMNWEPFRQA